MSKQKSDKKEMKDEAQKLENSKADKKSNYFSSTYNKVKKKTWALSSVVLGLLFLITLVWCLALFTSGVSATTAAQNLIDYAAEQGAVLELVDVNEVGGLYEVTVNIQGQEGAFYVTRDGKMYTSMLLPLETTGATQPNTPTPTEVPKSDKPEVELYVWGYCPYGVQAQGPLAEVVALLGNNVDASVVPFHDGHGPYETQQNQIQSCIQEVAPEKYWDYAAGFVEDIYPVCGSSRDVECDRSESVSLMDSLGIDSSAVMSCVETQGDELSAAARASASQNGVSGSPTLIINGVTVQTARTAEAYKTAICSAYNDAPEVCGEVLDSTAAAAAGSC